MRGKEPPAIVVVFDVRKVSDLFTDRRKCLERILIRKILSKSADRVGLILIGVEEGAECVFDLDVVSWELLRYVREELEPVENKNKGDWLEGVNLAIEKLSEYPIAEAEKKIVVIGNFDVDLDEDKVKTLTLTLKRMEYVLTLITPKEVYSLLNDDEEDDDDESEPHPKRFKLDDASLDLIKRMQNGMGDYMEISRVDQALHHLSCQPITVKKGRPWNCPLNIADFKINVSTYVKVECSKMKKPTTRLSMTIKQDENAAAGSGGRPVVPPREVDLDNEESSEPHWTAGSLDVVKAACYGSTLVPFSNVEKGAKKYKTGPKSLSVLGFTSLAKLNRLYLIGTGCHCIVPAKDDALAAQALSALVQALSETNRAAIARRVYAENRGLKLVLLSPVRSVYHEEEGELYKECLVMNELVWKEGIQKLSMDPLHTEITDKQAEALDALIDSMNLMEAGRDFRKQPVEAYPISELKELKNEYYFECLINRALNPDAPLPLDLPEPDNIKWEKDLKSKFDAVKKLFPIIPIEKEVYNWKPHGQIEAEEKVEEKIPLLADFPKPEIKVEDPEVVCVIKCLFQEHLFPAPKAIEYVIKGFESELPCILEALSECNNLLRAHCLEKEGGVEFNNWLKEFQFVLNKSSEETQKFIKEIIEGSNGFIPVADKKMEEDQEFVEETEVLTLRPEEITDEALDNIF